MAAVARRLSAVCVVLALVTVTSTMEQVKEQVDKVIEDEITEKLSEDLLQSIERKFQVDLEKAVDMVLVKIKLLLQNGTTHIQDRLVVIQRQMTSMKTQAEKEVETCLNERQNQTSALAEKALHQMVVCGYALIGHDPAKAVQAVVLMKDMIKQGLKPIHERKTEMYNVMKMCGHEHDALKKVIKCVISKSPLIKAAMMDVTGRLLDGVVNLTKLMAHGAMHEACLIEVLRTIQDEAFEILDDIRKCAYGNNSYNSHITDNTTKDNATVLDTESKMKKINEDLTKSTNKTEVKEIGDLIRRMLSDANGEGLDKKFKKQLKKLQKDLNPIDGNVITNEVSNKD